MKNLSYWITGDNPEHLKKHLPYSRKKIQMLANAVIIPTFIWLVFGFLISSNLMQKPWIQSVLTGLGCALIIFILDRSIVLAEGNSAIKWFRITLGFAVALVGAMLIDSVIFQSDVDGYLKNKYKTLAEAKIDSVASVYDGNIAQQKIVVDHAKTEWQFRTDQFNCEINGTCGTKRIGYSAASKAKENVMNQSKSEFERQAIILDKLILGKELSMANAKAGELSLLSFSSILERINCLHEVAFSSLGSGLLYFAFFLIALGVELFVICLKLCSRQSAYEKEQEILERIQLRKLEQVEVTSEYLQKIGYEGRAAQKSIHQKYHHPILN